MNYAALVKIKSAFTDAHSLTVTDYSSTVLQFKLGKQDFTLTEVDLEHSFIVLLTLRS